MSLYDLEQSVQTYLENNWTATSIKSENTPHDMVLPYIECFFRPGKVFSEEIGGVSKRVGIFIVHVFTNLDVGVLEGLSYCQLVEDLFFRKKIDNIYFDNDLLPYSEYVGVDKSIQAFQHNVVLPFYVIEHN